MTWYQVGTVFKELLEIRWPTNVFPKNTAVLTLQVGSVAHTQRSPKVWSLVQSVIITDIIIIIPGTGHTTAVTGVKISESGTVGLSSCMSYKRRLIAMFVIVVTAAQVIYLVCFLECVSQQLVIQQSLSSIIKQSSNTISRADSALC